MIKHCGGGSHCYELSNSQMNIWRLEQSFPGTSINNICETIRIRGLFDVTLAQQCLDHIVKNDPSLRTQITLNDDAVPLQYETEYLPLPWPVFDFSKTSRSGIEHWEQTVARQVMPVLDSPLFYFAIIRASENEGGILIKTHHLISDGWSQVTLINRIVETYMELMSGKNPEDKPSPSYRTHVEDEAAYMLSDAARRDREFFEEAVKQMPPPVSLKDCNIPVLSPVGKRKTYELSDVLNHAINLFCENHRVAPFAVFHMALAIYIKRVRGVSSLCIGAPVHNRANVTERDMTGMFVSTLPFCGALNEELSFEDFTWQLAEPWLDLLKHQKFPYSEIFKLYKENNPGADRLFNIVLSFHNSKAYQCRETSISFSGQWHYAGFQAEHLCVHLNNIEDERRFSVSYDFLTQLFSEQEVNRLHHYLTGILTRALASPEKPIKELFMLGDEEKEQVLYTFNRTDAHMGTMTVSEAVENQCHIAPQRVAVIQGGRRTTYISLIHEAEKIAAALASTGLGGKKTAAIFLPKSVELLEAMVGIVKAGCNWVILQPGLPEKRLLEILSDSGAEVLITTGEMLSKLNVSDIPVVDITNLPEASQGIVYPEMSASDLAYLVYTSGSTGKPKGIEIEQGSLMNFAESMKPLYGTGAVLSLCSIGFDAFLIESIVSLICSRTVVLPTDEESESPEKLAGLITDYAVGFLSLTPSRLAAYLKNEAFLKAAARLETIICGGEAFPASLLQALLKCTNAQIFNQYGPSETTIGVTAKQLNGASYISAGAPLRNCRCYVLNDDLSPLPVGVYGNLYIGGAPVGRGYRNEPELTGQTFVSSPFELGSRIYRTGDIAAWNFDGEILIKGREDSQVKLRGQRFELSEIAARLSLNPAVTQAAARICDINGQSVLIAYYVAGNPVSEAELLNLAAEYLPEYMIPSVFVFTKEFPLTENGKIDFGALPLPQVTESPDAAASDIGGRILSVFRRVLNRPDMTAGSDYFLFGGDSLNAMQTLSELQDILGTRLRVSDLYACRTALRLESLLSGRISPEPAAAVIKKTPAQQSYPLTSAQLGIYFESQRCTGSLAYNMPCGFSVERQIDEHRLHQAFCRLIETEPMLRAVFVFENGEIRQKIREDVSAELEILSFDTLSEAKAAFVRPFNPAVTPLIRVALWRNEKEKKSENAVLLDMHHIIGDGISAAVLLRRLDALYRGEDIAGPDIDYLDYVCFTEEAESSSDEHDYWLGQMKNVPGLPPLPADFPRTDRFDYKGSFCEFGLSVKESESCDDFCRRQGITVNALFTGAFGILISKLSDCFDFFTGMPASDRTDPALAETVGLLIKTLPLRLTPKEDMIAAEYFAEVRDRIAGIIDNKGISTDELMSMAETAGGQRACLYNTISSMRPFDIAGYTFDGQAVTPEIVPAGSAKTSLNLESARVGEGYRFRLEYAGSVFEQKTAELYGRCFTAILLETLQNESRKLSDYTALMPVDRYRLYDQSQALSAAFVNIPVHEQVEAAAHMNPGSVAVVFHDEVMTFEEIRIQSDALAAAMLDNGVCPGDSVGILCRRGAALVTAMLAALKIGCIYVPMLPNFPKNRVKEILDISGAKLTLCDIDTLASLPEGLPGIFMEIEGNSRSSAALTAGEYKNDIMCVLFTSGTTGQPKGVMIKHRSVANLIGAVGSSLSAVDGAFLCAANPIFDIFITETLIALALGKTVVMADEEEMVTPWKAAGLVRRHNVRFIEFTPSRGKLFFGNDAFYSAVSGIDHVIMCGEVLSPQLLEQIRGTKIKTIWNMYGPTETTVYSTMDDVTHARRITIGRMFANSRGYILNGRMRPVLPTAHGELYFSGECLASGYVGREDLTKESFISDPFYKGEVMYRSGDIVRLLPDGRIDFVGRKDHQVKFNGQRIELAEITQKLLDSKLIDQAATIVGSSGEFPVLCSFVTPPSDGTVDKSALRAFLKAELPAFMIPSEIHELRELPRTPTGKVDLQALSDMRPGGAEPPVLESDIPPEPPASEATDLLPVYSEQDIIRLWQTVLSRTDIDPELSFFEQGGTSLGALSLLSSYYNIGLTLSLEEFYNAPTLNAHKRMICSDGAFAKNDIAESNISDIEVNISGSRTEKSAVLVTGATGFFGAHLVKALIDAEVDEIFCLVRGDDTKRLFATFSWYFGDMWAEASKSVVRALKGNIVSENSGLSSGDLHDVISKTGTIIHAAADIRHYASDSAPIHTNVEGTRQMINLARLAGAKLIYISTISVCGEYLPAEPDALWEFREKDFDIGQNWRDNIYVRGKFLSEQLVVNEMKSGLSAAVYRIGRLVGRGSDGVFQKKPADNAFYQLINGVSCLDEIDPALAALPIELTAVDECAAAAVALLKSADGVYHLFQPEALAVRDIMYSLGRLLPETSRDSFERHLNLKVREGFGDQLAQLISHYNRFCAVPLHIAPVCGATLEKLSELGFMWQTPQPEKLLRCFLKEALPDNNTADNRKQIASAMI